MKSKKAIIEQIKKDYISYHFKITMLRSSNDEKFLLNYENFKYIDDLLSFIGFNHDDKMKLINQNEYLKNIQEYAKLSGYEVFNKLTNKKG